MPSLRQELKCHPNSVLKALPLQFLPVHNIPAIKHVRQLDKSHNNILPGLILFYFQFLLLAGVIFSLLSDTNDFIMSEHRNSRSFSNSKSVSQRFPASLVGVVGCVQWCHSAQMPLAVHL